MAEVAPAPVDPPAAKPKKRTAPKPTKNRSGPSIQDQIITIVSSSTDRKGVSTALLKKQLALNGYEVEKNKARIRVALKSLVKKGALNQASGIGASGSFKLAKKAGETKKKKKNTVASKVTPAKKPSSRGKAKKVQSPKKVKTAQSAKKKASPKKNSKKASKPVAAKKAPSVKSKKNAPSKSPKPKKAVPKKKPAAKKEGKSKVKKTGAKK